MSEDAPKSADPKRPIQFRFSGGTDFDNDISMSGLTFEEAMQITRLVSGLIRDRKAGEPAPPTATTDEGRPA